MSRVIKHILDDHGRAVALVPLGRKGEKGTAVIEDEDLSEMTSLGLSLRWNRHSGTGVVFAPASGSSGGNVQVARVLLDLGPGENVRYLSGDPTDLRRSNLVVNPEGNAVRRDRDYLTPADRRRQWGPAVQHEFF